MQALFGARPAEEGQADSAFHLALSSSVCADIDELESTNGFLPGTVWLSACLWTLQGWTGDESVCWWEGAPTPALRHVHAPVDASCAGWSRAVDRARRAASAAVDPGTAPEPVMRWDADAPAGSGTAFLRMGIDGAAGAGEARRLWLAVQAVPGDAALGLRVLERIVQNAQRWSARWLESVQTIASTTGPDQQDERLVPAAVQPRFATVQSAFAEQVRLRGSAPAVQHGERLLDYAALDRRSSAVAAGLRAVGVKPGDVVAVALERSLDAIVAWVGIVKAGAAYLPISGGNPPDRIALMARDAAITHAVVDPDQRHFFEASVSVSTMDALAQLEPGAPHAPGVGADVAYVMYTSGSTGQPNGIEITHDAILRLTLDARYVDLSPAVRMLHAAPSNFDASTFEIWGPLLNGGCCVLHDEALPTGSGLRRTILRGRVTTAVLTTGLFNAVVDDDPLHLAGLSQLVIGGEALSVPHVRRALDALPRLVLINGYGPTETTTLATSHRIPRDLAANALSVPIGQPITDTTVSVLDARMQPVPQGLVGELFVGGRGLAKGYLRRPDLTAERFVPDPLGRPGDRLYRTGDLVRVLPNGDLDFIGRRDAQIKLRGHRIEPAEVEAALASHDAVRASSVQLVKDPAGHWRLVAYVVARGVKCTDAALGAHLATRLPAAMRPTAIVWLDKLPLTPNGKLDRRALPSLASSRPLLQTAYRAPVDAVERRLCATFAELLGLDRVGLDDNFFALGGDSLLAVRAIARLARELPGEWTVARFFADPTPAGLASERPALSADDRPVQWPGKTAPQQPGVDREARTGEPIAIIAMAGRFPGAGDVEAFWDNLRAGRDSITVFRDEELDPSLPAALVGDPLYVKARGVIEGVELFDAGFFGMSARDAALMDPQQRVFLELCWECIERGGYAPDAMDKPVGVFAGMHVSSYYQHHVRQHPALIEQVGEFQTMLANEKDYLATQVAWRLDLTGPAISINTACSTSLVAIAQACASLRAGQCDAALAGGASITCPPASGHLYNEGSMLSPDGRTRSFAATAQGTTFSDGAGVVMLKRLADAIADGDPVIAVIRGEAVNNDGRRKASFTAPGVSGQAAVIVSAQRAAGVWPHEVSYIEAHGTATPLGDPIEIEALTRAFGRTASAVPGACRIGSLKSNVGHLVIAAGVAGVIKTALALEHGTLPASLHFDAPNPHIPFAASPFVVNARLSAWPRDTVPRRAGVSSFGVGGTNAHVVMEEAPWRLPSTATGETQLLLLAAKSASALDAMASRLATHLDAHPDLDLADVAHTLQVGRSRFPHRLAVTGVDARSVVDALRQAAHPARVTGVAPPALPQLVWLFPGQGAQYARMGSALHASDTAFRTAFDAAAEALGPSVGSDFSHRVLDGSDEALRPTAMAQPALFCIGYAMAQAWLARGIAPNLLIGHSVGEFVAAVLAGVMPLADAAALVAQRGALLQRLPEGCMVSVQLPARELESMLPAALSLAAENGPRACVIAGPCDAVTAFVADLEGRGVATRSLPTSHAFHSAMMDPAVEPFERAVRAIALSAPRIPIVSTVTGRLLTAAEATDPHYWARHLRAPVRFSAAVRTAMSHGDVAFVEVGPRGSLSALVRRHPDAHGSGSSPIAFASLGAEPGAEPGSFAGAQGRLWTLGFELRTPADRPTASRRRVRLPTYPFERQRHWLQAQGPSIAPVPRVPSIPLLVPAMSSPASHATRLPSIVERLRRVFTALTGAEFDGGSGASFIELGLDSLTLTQAAIQVRREFAVPVTFRQLMENLRSIDALAAYLNERLPVDTETTAEAAKPSDSTPALAPRPAPMPVPDSLQGVVQQQLQLMAQQLALLAGQAPTAAPVILPAPAPTPPVAPSAPVRYDVKAAFGAIARIHTQPLPATERQRARLAAFTRRYTDRTRASKDYTAAHRPHLADPRVVNGFRPLTKEITYQIVIERSKGARLWDIDGNEYVDALNGFGMSLFGWQADFVKEAVQAQLDAGYEIGPQHPLAGEVAQLLCELTGFDRAAMCNTGSEAVMAAIRIARTVTGRQLVVMFSGSYHGTFDEVLVRPGGQGKGISAAPGVLSEAFDNVRVLDYGTDESLDFIRKHAKDIAAVLVEPVQSRRPALQPVEFLKTLRTITTADSICLVFDEVITGFRAHLGGAQAMFGVRADLAAYGKVIGGGFPIGVIAGTRDYMDALDGGAWAYGDESAPTVGVTYFAGTFVRHPMALAAARASLRHLRACGPALQAALNQTTAAMVAELAAFCAQAGAPIAVQHFASLWRVSWLEEHPLQDLLFAMMRSRGVHILDNFPCFLTTAHTAQDVREIVEAFKASVHELQESEFLPRGKAAPSHAVDAAKPPVPGARLGKDPEGRPGWFIRNPENPAKFVKVSA